MIERKTLELNKNWTLYVDNKALSGRVAGGTGFFSKYCKDFYFPLHAINSLRCELSVNPSTKALFIFLVWGGLAIWCMVSFSIILGVLLMVVPVVGMIYQFLPKVILFISTAGRDDVKIPIRSYDHQKIQDFFPTILECIEKSRGK